MNDSASGLAGIFLNIVVIEDDPVLRMLLSEIISDSGADCHVFTNCDQALMYLSAGNTCEAVIADHGVPGKLQGTEFIRKVQELWPRVRCVLTSGYDLSTIELPGNCIYLPKPWTPASLLGALG